MIIQSAKVSEFYKHEDYYPKWVLWVAKKLNITIDRNTEYAFQAAVTVSKEGIENNIPLAGYVFYVAGLTMYCALGIEDTMVLWTTKTTDKILSSEDFVGQSIICLYQTREETQAPKTSVIKGIASIVYSLFFFKRQPYLPRYLEIFLGINAWFNLGLLLINALYKLL